MRDVLPIQVVNLAVVSTLHHMASSDLHPWKKADSKSEWRKLLERLQTKICENTQKSSMVLCWKQAGILHLGTCIGTNLGYHQCMRVRACAAMQ